MRILEYRSIGGRDFHATMECEHCGGTQEIKTGYNDAYYHRHVIPAMTCKACGKNRAGEIPAESNDYGMKPVEIPLRHRQGEGIGGRVVKDMEDIKIAREETDLEWQPVLDGVHAYADLRRLGRRLAVERLKTDETIAYLTGQLERAISNVEKLTRERNKMRAEVEELRTRTAAQLEIETRARDEARADAARLHEALEALTYQTGSLLSELEYQQVSCPLCGEDPGEGKDALCGVVKVLGEASSKARALIAQLKGRRNE